MALLVDVAECWIIFPGDVPDIRERVLNRLEGREVLREPAFNGCIRQVQRGLLVSSGPALGEIEVILDGRLRRCNSAHDGLHLGQEAVVLWHEVSGCLNVGLH